MAKDKKKTSENAEASAVEETKSTKKKAKSEDTKPAKKDKSGSKKDSKKDAGKKNVFKSIGKWFHDLKVEFKNVTWPSRNTVVINTSVVLFVVVAGSIIIGLIDSGLLKLMQFLIGLSQ